MTPWYVNAGSPPGDEYRPLHEELLLDEFKEAWGHYRHTESLRTQYVAFFFTVLIASLGAASAIVGGEHPPSASVLLSAAYLLLWLLSILSYMIYASVRRATFVLKHYVSVMDKVRELACASLDADQVKERDVLRISRRTDAILGARTFSTGRSYQTILLSGTVLLSVAQGALFYAIIRDPQRYGFADWQQITMVVLGVSFLVYAALAAADLVRVSGR